MIAKLILHEPTPVFFEFLAEVGGQGLVERYRHYQREGGFGYRRWLEQSLAQRRATRPKFLLRL